MLDSLIYDKIDMKWVHLNEDWLYADYIIFEAKLISIAPSMILLINAFDVKRIINFSAKCSLKIATSKRSSFLTFKESKHYCVNGYNIFDKPLLFIGKFKLH